jgi:outer membrane protein
MKRFLYIILIFFFNWKVALAENDIYFFLESAFKNNPKLNAERQNFEATKQNINISKSNFLPSVSVSNSLDNVQSTNRTNQTGARIADVSSEKETKTFSVDQKLFQGFGNYNNFKKSQLEVEQAKFRLKNIEQEIISEASQAYFDLIYKTMSKKFNLANVDLFERQVETDSIRLQKGEISLTDLAQSESSLAGARAELITAETELLTVKTNFERIITLKAPNQITKKYNFKLSLPSSLAESLIISKKNNPELIISQLDYEISKRDLNIKKSEVAPSASINYSKSKIDDFSSSIDNVDQESFKATINWPIISGGKNYSSIKKSKLKKVQNNLILEDTINEIKTETTNAWAVYQSAGSVLKATQAQVKAAEIANEGISLEYDSGNTRTTLEVIQSRSLLLDSRIANAKAERNFAISKINLLSILGNLDLNSFK